MKRLILFFAIVFLGAGLRAASVLPVGEGKFTYKDLSLIHISEPTRP